MTGVDCQAWTATPWPAPFAGKTAPAYHSDRQSDYGQAEDVQKAHEARLDMHLIKPVDFNEPPRIL